MSNKTRLIMIVISSMLILYASMLGEGSAFNLVTIWLFVKGMKDCITKLIAERKENKNINRN
ncbi:MAG: hypothetical protein ACRCYC_15445 [Paraclostridium sp.]|uniref:hypothetical protein n=1 Tax=Paraclostridium sp. TaxID=2023273 RepID=UPI003F4098B3